MNCSVTTLAILAVLSASLAVAENFTTINGRIYKDATISRVEADGIVIRSKTGISKIYFVELPEDVRERFHFGSAASATPTGKAVTQRIDEAEGAKQPAAYVDFANKFSERVATKLDEREAILNGKQPKTRSRAESMAIQELNFHWAFLAAIAIVASVLFAIVWARVK